MKEEVIDILQQRQWQELSQLLQSRKKGQTVLFRLLYHPEDELHWLAAEGIGRYGRFLAQDDAEKTREILRRLLWNLNEECGASPWGSMEAIGAIVVGRPDLFFHHISIMFAFLEDENLIPGFLWTLAGVGKEWRLKLQEYLPFVRRQLNHEQAKIRAYAIQALQSLEAWKEEPLAEKLRTDSSSVSLYSWGGYYQTTTVSAVAHVGINRESKSRD